MSTGKGHEISPFLIWFGIVIFFLITIPRMIGKPILPSEQHRLERIKAANAKRAAEQNGYNHYNSVQR